MTSLCNWLPWTPSVLTLKLVKANRAAYCASNSTATYMIQTDIGIGGGGDWNLKSESTFPFALAGKKSIKRWAIRWTLGCVNPASWLPLAAGRKFTQLRAHLIAQALFCSHCHKTFLWYFASRLQTGLYKASWNEWFVVGEPFWASVCLCRNLMVVYPLVCNAEYCRKMHPLDDNDGKSWNES